MKSIAEFQTFSKRHFEVHSEVVIQLTNNQPVRAGWATEWAGIFVSKDTCSL